MGLEDFTSGGDTSDDDDSDSSSSKSKSGSTSSRGTKKKGSMQPIGELEMSFYDTGNIDLSTRPMERKGAMSDYRPADLQHTKEGNIEVERDSIKFFLPMFAMVTRNPEYVEGERYQLKHRKDSPRASWHNKVVACATSKATSLGNINKEMVMLAAGTTSKKRAMEFINSKFGESVTGDTNVYVSYMLDTMFCRDLAQASEQFRAGDNIDRDAVNTRVMTPKMLRLALEDDEDN